MNRKMSTYDARLAIVEMRGALGEHVTQVRAVIEALDKASSTKPEVIEDVLENDLDDEIVF